MFVKMSASEIFETNAEGVDFEFTAFQAVNAVAMGGKTLHHALRLNVAQATDHDLIELQCPTIRWNQCTGTSSTCLLSQRNPLFAMTCSFCNSNAHIIQRITSTNISRVPIL